MQFLTKVKPDLSNYDDEAAAFPTLIDDFVDYVNSGGKNADSDEDDY